MWVLCAYMTDPQGPQTRVSFPMDNTRPLMSHAAAGRMKHIGMTPHGDDTWELMPGFSLTWPHGFLPFTDFHLYPFAVRNPNCEYTSFSGSHGPF